uniref:Uncharacterized protein n=1 Tax=viral metagenome TaxID=1070528 RepID=A0A6H1ZGN8_9ZZZZ
MTPELKRLEMEVFKSRKDRRIKNIREAFAAYCRSLEPKKRGFWFSLFSGRIKGRSEFF